MHPLHDYVAGQVVGRLNNSKVVVWYDPREEYVPFFDEVLGEGFDRSVIHKAELGGQGCGIAFYSGSYLELRLRVENLVSEDLPEPLLIYLPGIDRDRNSSLLMELEKAGNCYEPQLKRLGRIVLEKLFTSGEIDEVLQSDSVGYHDIARMASGGGLSILKGVFPSSFGSDEILASWLTDGERDEEITSKGAIPELAKLIESRLGLTLDPADLFKMRAITLRYVLGNEFRADLLCEPPESLTGIPRPPRKEHLESVRGMARRLRKAQEGRYEEIADRVELELRLKPAGIAASYLGAIDTFRFEEQALLDHCGSLVEQGRFEEAMSIIEERQDSYWLDRDCTRKAQWEAIRMMARLGIETSRVAQALKKTPGRPEGWIQAYASTDGWHLMDRAQRSMESWIASLADEPLEAPLTKVRGDYDETCGKLASGFTRSLEEAGWSVDGVMHQTGFFDKMVQGTPKPVAVFFVDSLRFEMGAELAGKMRKSDEIRLTPAIAAIPGITSVGMAALLPGASASFSIGEQNGRLAPEISGAVLLDQPARKRFLTGKIPGIEDITLDRLLGLTGRQLSKHIENVQMLIVRSQEIDLAGEEAATGQARSAMGGIVDNLGRAIRKLAAAGMDRSVVVADHGHLFASYEREESMRVDPSGGTPIELHRRVWIGRGGGTPAGCRRVSADRLGYVSDLEFVFPPGTAVFRSGGDLVYHHGGLSLQELVIPVLEIRLAGKESPKARRSSLSVTGVPAQLANLINSFQVTSMLDDSFIPSLLCSGRAVGGLYSAVDAAQIDRDAGVVQLLPGVPCTVVIRLMDEDVSEVDLVLTDPASDAELERFTSIPVRLGVR